MEPTADHNSKNLIGHIQLINTRLENSKLRPSALLKIDPSLEFVSASLNCTRNQAMLFALIFGLNLTHPEVSLFDMAEFLDCSSLTIAAMIEDLDVLMNRHVIRMEENYRQGRLFGRNTGYFVSSRMFDQVLRGQVGVPPSEEKPDIIGFLSRVQNFYEGRDIEEMNHCEINDELDFLLSSNTHLPFVNEARKYELCHEEKHILLITAYNLFDDCDSVDLDNILDKVFKNNLVRKYQLRKSVIRGDLTLMKKEFMEVEDSFFRNDRYIRFTDKGIETFFPGETTSLSNKLRKNQAGLIPARNIAQKDLFFNQEEQEQFRFLENALKQENLSRLQQRLQEQNLPTGLAVLFHGAPGTGKTEMVYQLARKTGRELQVVDISATKTMWFGESEKIIKKIFVKYKAMSESQEICPILFFNEADAVFGKRRELGRSAVDQTENTIQNIILQEMESMKGILVATTNLTINLDSAFDRRFLYKIRFGMPGPEVRSRIWKSKIPSLTARQAALLAGKYAFSGGQIDNICRKYITHQVLTGEDPDLEIIEKFCEQENSGSHATRIGF